MNIFENHISIKLLNIALFLMLINLFHANLLAQSSYSDSIINIQTQKFKFLLETINRNYPDTADIKELSDKSLNYLMQSLDKDCFYYTENQYKLFKDSQKGSSLGVGINFIILNDTITVTGITPMSPADSAGILPGDKILFIDGSNALNIQYQEALSKILGGENTIVSIIIRRGAGANLLEYSLPRRETILPSITSAFILPNSQIGYICYNRFSSLSHFEFVEQIDKFIKQGIKSLILDLRGNPGGWLDQVCQIADEFLPEGELLTYTKAKNPDFDFKYVTKSKGRIEKMPLIVLLDQNSASGSEIIAGALQDLDRGLVFGETSYGKATAQRMWDFRDGSGFKMTVAGYHSPSGRKLQKQNSSAEKPSLDPSAMLNLDKDTYERLQKAIAGMDGRLEMPIHKSKGGRSIIGGGGVAPDYLVKNDTVTVLTRVLKEKAFFLEYSFLYLSNAGSHLREMYRNDFVKFNSDFNISDLILDDFKNFSLKKNIWNEQMFQIDKLIIAVYLKANIASALFGNNGSAYVMSSFDKTISKAAMAMPEAAKMLNK